MRLAVLLGFTIALLAAAPASAAGGPCLPSGWSPTCTFWTGKVVFVADGDTIDVDIDGDGTRAPRRVRLTGFNAMELRRYSHTPSKRRGDCHGVEATARLERLIRRSRMRVRLAAQDRSSHAKARLRRQVSVRLGGEWVDLGRIMLAEGHALWLPNSIEWAWNRSYAALSERAAQQQRRLWNPDGCGRGPAADLALTLNPNADGEDWANVAGEWAEIHNRGSRPVSLHRWWFRDSGLRRYTFPRSAVVPPHGSVTLRMGRGHDAQGVFHWGLTSPPLDNLTIDDRAMGDGGYLFDPRGNLRRWVIYH